MTNDYISRQDVQLEIMSDGTLHITATVDVANTDRILLSQTGTHLGDLYYKDDERKKGKLIDADALKEWVENWLVKNQYYHPYAKKNNIPIPVPQPQ